MKKNIFNFFLNVAVFWMVVDSIPGFKAPYGAISKLYAGLAFAVIMIVSDYLRSMLRLPKVFTAKILIGGILTFLGLWFVNNFAPNFFSFGQSYIGGGNYIFFTLPKILVLQDTNLVLLFAALVGNICSIIIFKLKK